MIRHLPNALTLLNLFCGTCAIALLVSGAYDYVLLLAIACIVLDVCDGLLARRLNLTSELGVQLDSLADLVSFGVLPGMILFVLISAASEVQPLPIWLPYVGCVFPAAVALRLARFNVDTRGRTVFYGLPTPSAAAVIFGLLWMSAKDHALYPVLGHWIVLCFLVIILAFHMQSDLQLWSLKGISQRNGKTILAAFLIVFGILLIWQGAASVTLMVFAYLLFGIINTWFKIYGTNEV